MNRLKQYWQFCVVLLIGLVALVVEFGLGNDGLARGIVTVVGTIMALLMVGEMVRTLMSGKVGIDLLAITAIGATLIVGEYWAALIVLLMLTGGEALEDYAANKAKRELKSLLANTPTVAHQVDGDTVTDVEIDTVQVGTILLVRPGEVIPVDARVVSGETEVDESSITGESRLLAKIPGDTVLSGAVNGDTAIRVEVLRIAAHSQYQGIVRLVKESISKPAPFVRLADRYAVPFTLVAYVIAGCAWFFSGNVVRVAEVLVVASPCPLILAAPIAMVSGMSRASRSGVIVKSGAALEKMAVAKTVAFDKTGTITIGKLAVTRVVPATTGHTKDRLLSLAAAAESHSGHVLARSLQTAVDISSLTVSGVREATGNGVAAVVDGHSVQVGKASYVGADTQSEQTAVYVAVDGQYAGYIEFMDVVRPEAAATMAALRDQEINNLIMISGDRIPTAKAIAAEAGIYNVYGEQLPVDKINILRNVGVDARPVVMVGDGVNDAPSLAAADVGIAMGANGATAASESADIVILRDDLGKVSEMVAVSRHTMLIARQAVLIGIVICTVLMVIASIGVIPAIFGAMLQEVIDTVTILYALKARN